MLLCSSGAKTSRTCVLTDIAQLCVESQVKPFGNLFRWASLVSRPSSRAPCQNHALNTDEDLVCTQCMFRSRQLVLVSLFLRPRVREDLLPPSELGLKAPPQRPPPDDVGLDPGCRKEGNAPLFGPYNYQLYCSMAGFTLLRWVRALPDMSLLLCRPSLP